jgi:hypothetical protein
MVVMVATHDADAPVAETYTSAEILAFARAFAAERAQGRAEVYLRASPGRAAGAADLASQLLSIHLRYLRAHSRGHGRRRMHNAHVFDLLENTNEATLVLALALLEVMIGLLPPSRTARG